MSTASNTEKKLNVGRHATLADRGMGGGYEPTAATIRDIWSGEGAGY